MAEQTRKELRSSHEARQKTRIAKPHEGQERRISRRETSKVSNATKKLGRKKKKMGIGYSDLKVILVYGPITYVLGVPASHKCHRIQNGNFAQTARGCVSDTKVNCEVDSFLKIST